jgi:hypothetical protein
MRRLYFALSLLFASSAFAGLPVGPLSVSDVSGMQIRPDGNYDVICTTGARETVTAIDVQIGNVCPNRAATSGNTGIISVQRRPDGQFNVMCKDNSVVVASANDIMNGTVCRQTVGLPVDMVWVVGGMTEQAQNFQTGVTSFMTDFLQKSISWRMGVLGSDQSLPPYLGMPTVFDNTTPSPLPTIINGIMSALMGLDGEQIFDPLVKGLTGNPTFIRPGAKLVILITNDAHDASKANTKASQMVSFLQGLKGGNLSDVVVYGIFGAIDLNCAANQIDEQWNYKGSEFEALIQATGGQAYSLCDKSFAASLSLLAADLYHKLNVP